MYPGRLLVLGVIGASIVRTGPMHTGETSYRVHAGAPRVVVGERPPRPGAAHAVSIPVKAPSPWSLRGDVVRVVRGDAPATPLPRTLRVGEWHTGAVPITPASVPRTRIAHGTEPPTPSGSAQRVIPQRAQVADWKLERHTAVTRGDSPPAPDGRVVRVGQWHTGAFIPTDINHNLLEPRIVYGDDPTVPVGRVLRLGGPRTVVTFNQQVVQPRVLPGDPPPVPPARVRRIAEFHTGTAPPVPAAITGGFLGRAFTN